MRANQSDGSLNKSYTSRQATKQMAIAFAHSAVEVDTMMTQLLVTDGAFKLLLSNLGSEGRFSRE
jgi:hypothetical protein